MPEVLAALALSLCLMGFAVLMYLGYGYDRFGRFLRKIGREVILLLTI